MHECRIYSDYPEQGGRLTRVISKEEARRLHWKDFSGSTRKTTTKVCAVAGCDVEFQTTATNARYCPDHRQALDEQYKYL